MTNPQLPKKLVCQRSSSFGFLSQRYESQVALPLLALPSLLLFAPASLPLFALSRLLLVSFWDSIHPSVLNAL
jgi:hypothetical protein